MAVRKVFALGVLSGLILCAAAVAIVRTSPAADPALPARLEIWSHQGYTLDAPPNSLRSVAAAIDAGADGVELDVHYDARRDRFVVSRTPAPYQAPEGRLLPLEELLRRFGARTRYWIDLKNLSLSNAEEVAQRMATLLEGLELTERTFVESTRGWPLGRLTAAGLKTIYTVDLQPHSASYIPRIVAATAMVALRAHTVIGVPHESMNGLFMRLFGRRPLFVFTVNEPQRLQELRHVRAVRVVLSDELFATAHGAAASPVRD